MFADVSCPFAHVGLSRVAAYRDSLGVGAPSLRVRSWPLERVNGSPLAGSALGPKVAALRRDVAPELFSGFDPSSFPATTRHALAAEQRAYRVGVTEGLAFSLAIRRRLFEEGADIGDPTVVLAALNALGLPPPSPADHVAVDRDHTEGVARGVQGSPHFFTPNGSFFCPTLDIRHGEGGYEIEFDAEGFEAFIAAAFA